MTHWLMKSEPTEYSIDDLKRDGSSSWFWVRNYLARNYMRDSMKIGDRVLFYHSNCKVPGIAWIAEVVSGAHPDATQFMSGSKYYDPKSKEDTPIWQCVDVGFVEKFERPIGLPELRSIEELASMKILEKGNRLSITPVRDYEYQTIMKIAGQTESGTTSKKHIS